MWADRKRCCKACFPEKYVEISFNVYTSQKTLYGFSYQCNIYNLGLDVPVLEAMDILPSVKRHHGTCISQMINSSLMLIAYI